MVLPRQVSRAVALSLSLALAPSVFAQNKNNWTGFHAGIGIGHGMMDQPLDFETAALPDNPFSPAAAFAFSGIGGEGALASVEAGFGVQLNRYLVLGGILDYTRSNISTQMRGYLDPLSADYDLTAAQTLSALVRLGVPVRDATLIYGLAGRSRTRFDGDAEVTDIVRDRYSFDVDGWTVGGGIESVIADNMSLKFEYRYTRNEKLNLFDTPGSAKMDAASNLQTARVVLSYRPGTFATPFDGSEERWNSFHIGVGGGYTMLNHATQTEIYDVADLDVDGLAGEGFNGRVELGRDVLLGERFVIGASLGYSYANAISTLDIHGVGVGASIDVEGTHTFDAVARAGILSSPDVLWYGLAGWSLTDFNGVIDDQVNPLDDFDFKLHGFTAGAGVEVMLADNISLKTEYRYINYFPVDTELLELALMKDKANAHSVRAVLSFRF